MFQNLAAMANLMKQGPQIAQRAAQLKQQLAAKTVEGVNASARVVMTCDYRIVEVQLFDLAHENKTKDELARDIQAATDQALTLVRQTVSAEMSLLASELGIPHLGDVLSKFGI